MASAKMCQDVARCAKMWQAAVQIFDLRVDHVNGLRAVLHHRARVLGASVDVSPEFNARHSLQVGLIK